MSDTVRLNIVSGFDAQGIQQARQGVTGLAASTRAAASGMGSVGSSDAFETLAGKAKKGARAVGMLSQAIGDDKGGVAYVAKAAGGALLAFAAGGWVALLLAGAATVVQHFVGLRAEAAKTAEEMRKAFRAGLEQAKARQIESLKEEYRDLGKEIEAASAKMEKLAADNSRYGKAGNAVDSASAADTQKNIEAYYATRSAAAATPEERAAVAAERNLELAKAAGAEQVRSAQAEVAAGESAADTERQRVALAQERLSAAREQLKLAESEAAKFPAKGYDKERKAANELVSAARDDVSKASADIAAGEINVQSSLAELEAANIKLRTARTEAALRETEAVTAQEALTSALARRAKVADRLAAQEQRLAAHQAAFETAQAAGQRKEGARDAAVAGGAAAMHAARDGARSAKKEIDESNRSEERWAKNAEKKLAAGRKLTARDRQRLADFKDFQQLRNRGGQKEFDLAKAEADKLAAIRANLKELEKLNATLERNLIEGGR